MVIHMDAFLYCTGSIHFISEHCSITLILMLQLSSSTGQSEFNTKSKGRNKQMRVQRRI